MSETKDTLDLTYVPITGPGVDALENRKESNREGVTEEQLNIDLRRYMDSGKMRKTAKALAVALAEDRADLS